MKLLLLLSLCIALIHAAKEPQQYCDDGTTFGLNILFVKFQPQINLC